ncbi:short coiled-coil protein isoform X1 [Cricetulus griseus]|uniref:short coiled-coil protein isoform X1 n=1 Tax=Cricetulus griseus TaxID=10029 RepID=UPI00022F6492|nr:short coiled-coil protein isoform X1 [Cricetulus griseus]
MATLYRVPGETKPAQRGSPSLERHPFCVVIGRCFSKTHPTILIGRQCPFVRAKVDPGAPPGAGSGRPAANAQACDLAVGVVGVRLLARRTLRGRGGRSCCCQLVRELRPEASYPSRPLPAPQTQDHSSKSVHPRAESLFPKMMNADMDAVDAENQVELEEKTRLINQVLELQHTLEDLSARVDAVKEENLKLKSENQVLGQYIENLMSASSVFQTTDTKSKRK